MEDRRKRIAVIDGNSLMHRAYHAVPPTMNAPDGTPTNAVFGFLNMLIKFIEIARPDAIVCAFDAGKPKFRMEALEQYKAQRPPMDDELRVQFPLMEELLASLAIPVVKVPGWEGDDILGTVAARDEALGYETLLVTGDKDACQLASELTKIVTTRKGITDIDIMTPARVEEKYGVDPGHFPDFLGLMGDSSDNIPGVPGVGAKTAAKYLAEYGSMEGLYEHADEIKGKTGQKVRENKELAFLSRKIATIVRDLDFELDVEAVAWPAFETAQVKETFGKFALRVPLAKMLSVAQGGTGGGTGGGGAADAAPGPAANAGARCAVQAGGDPVDPVDPGAGAAVARACPAAELSWEPLLEGERAHEALRRALDAGETVSAAFCEPAQQSLFGAEGVLALRCEAGTAIFRGDEANEAFAAVVRACPFVTFDAKADLQRIYPRDTMQAALVDAGELRAARIFDVGLAGYLLDSSRGNCTLGELFEARCGLELPTSDDIAVAAAVNAAAGLALMPLLEDALRADGSLACYRDIDLPLIAVLLCMERTGVAIDAAALERLGAVTGEEKAERLARIYELAGHEFNADSPKQLATVLFEEMGIKPLKKTSRGYSTDASVLTELAKHHELPACVLEYRTFAKLKSTYIDALPKLKLRSYDGRIHTSFNQKVTSTGRLSSSDPNLQNIPVRTDFGRRIRSCFVPLDPGEVFVSADYSQIELRLLAHLSQDEHLVAAFLEGEDFHAQTAARVFGVDVSEVTPAMRSRAKAVNFGIVYGQQAYGLASSLDIPFGEAKEMIQAYYAAYPGVRRFLDETVAKAHETGFAETLFGRKRHIPELKARNANTRNFGERTAMNHPMQGTAADIIKIAMARVEARLAADGLRSRMILQVHDELDFSAPAEEVPVLTALVREIMEGVVELRVPLLVDVSVGENWAQAH